MRTKFPWRTTHERNHHARVEPPAQECAERNVGDDENGLGRIGRKLIDIDREVDASVIDAIAIGIDVDMDVGYVRRVGPARCRVPDVRVLPVVRDTLARGEKAAFADVNRCPGFEGQECPTVIDVGDESGEWEA